MLFAKAAIAFLLMPGIVAFGLPLVLAPVRLARPDGLLLVAVGTTFLLWCVREFYVSGKGTLAPWQPPTELVVTGLYRLSRNPMYVAVALILWGWALAFRSRNLAFYALAVMVAFHLRVIFYEEPTLARAFGQGWTRYTAKVPRWLSLSRLQ